jgi:hypothetical protein
MIIEVFTESGAVYKIDTDAQTWSREDGSSGYGIRTSTGVYDTLYPIEVGKPLVMIGDGLVFGIRVIQTSLVTEVRQCILH